jgi:2-hydroxy-6-oxonona-2,4-dienedioate hydrolase
MLRKPIIIGLILLVLLILFLTIVLPKYLKDLRKAKDNLSVYATKLVETPIGTIEYYRKGNGYPILISHGITGGFDQGIGLARNYIGGEYDYIAVSRFGYLNSELPKDSSPDAQADAFKYLLDKLNIDKAFIFGNSAGGTSAIKFALKYPDRCLGLVLVSSNVPNEKALPPKPVMKAVFGSDFIYWSFSKLMKDYMLSMIGVTDSIKESLTREEKEKVFNEVILGGLPISLRTKGVINDMFLSNPDIKKGYEYENIKVPVLMVHCKDDTLCPYEEALAVAKRIPKAELFTVDTGGHLVLGKESETQIKIMSFIKATMKAER